MKTPITRPLRALLALAALTAAVLLPATSAAAATTPAAGTAAEAATVLELTNTARAEHDAAPVAYSPAVAEVAQSWAEQLARSGELSHDADYATKMPDGWLGVAENVAMSSDATPADLHAMWMDSPGHRANLLNSGYNVMGVGLATADDGTLFGVEVFGRYADPVTAGAEPLETPDPTANPTPPAPIAPEPVPEATETGAASPEPQPAAPVPSAVASPGASERATSAPVPTGAVDGQFEAERGASPRAGTGTAATLMPFLLPAAIGCVVVLGGVSAAAFTRIRRSND
ncbi:CAP domain-containing protein [Microbacterium gorillae]|uniref:CAP domain-containing protein n=1 Tax=Microbacterium gorillae TaxID=1231063 RepID=UPI000590AA84|nr:CAP domain-containing protein [Microbacterium gorillae]